MMRLLVTFSLFALLACGGPSGESTDEPPVSARPETASPGQTASPGETGTAQVDPQVASCLDLVKRGRFQEALPVCMAALKIAPDDPDVQAAAQRAQVETSKLADAEGAAEGAKSEAAGQLDDASKGLSGQLGQ